MTQVRGQAVEVNGTINRGITPIVDYLKACDVQVYHFADAGDRVHRVPKIWFRGGDEEGHRAVEVVRDFARERGYKLGVLRREWLQFSEFENRPAKPNWVLVFCVPKNQPNDTPTVFL